MNEAPAASVISKRRLYPLTIAVLENVNSGGIVAPIALPGVSIGLDTLFAS